MAYGNWGAFVYRDGERMEAREDATPYKESDLEPGNWQAFMRSEGADPHHAVLGQGRIRLCGYKNYPVLFVDGEKLDMEAFKKPGKEARGEWDYDCDFEGEVERHTFRAHQYNGNMIQLYLREPDGTVWTATCGYCYGAGHMD